MQITDIRCEKLSGTFDRTPAEFFEGWLSQPVDVYGEFGPHTGGDDVAEGEDQPMELEQVFVTVETTTGAHGMAGPLYGGAPRAALVLELEELLVGRDPLATEKLWDLMYREEVHGRKGKTMHAVSAIDCALWDLKGRTYDEPVWRLLGGPTRDEIPVYASMLGYSADPEDVGETAAAFAQQGYDAQKWFFQNGVGSGRAGQRKNAALVEAAREAVGDEYDLMFDAWMSWDLTYARQMFDRIAKYQPRWIEEPLQPDKIDQYAKLRTEAPFPITGGEHEYTRWGAQELLSRDAVDVLQPDTSWGGGITEIDKICTLASVRDVPVVPHGWSMVVNRHVAAAQPPNVCPMVEHLVKSRRRLEHFLEVDIEPEDGAVPVPDEPGLGISIDSSVVEERTEIAFD